MRFNTNFKLFSLFLSVSVAAPIAQYSEVVSAGNQIDNGIDASSNNFFTGTSDLGMGADDAFLMAARRQRDKDRRYRPAGQPQISPKLHQNGCRGDSTEPSCQPEEQPTPTPPPEQEEFPDPWLDELEEAGGALGIWGLLDLLNDPNPGLSH